MTSSRWSYPLYRLVWSSLDWLFPPRCGGCGKLGSRWCDTCQEKTPRLDGVLCEKCGLPIRKPGLCDRCRAELPPYQALRSWAVFDSPVRQALHKLKYRRDMGLGDALAVPISEFTVSLNWPFEVVLPVPLGQKRMRERGYNQIALIAHPLSLSLGREYRPAALKRKRETNSQVGLSAIERRENVKDAFTADPRFIGGKTVLVLDDVATTGSTLSSCAMALLQSGAKDVYALTVARALPHHGLDKV
ncbi:MAG: ComF family protein [Chloroflexi bacterium]|nr:ComF family protein [Chloroflexota bacterium]